MPVLMHAFKSGTLTDNPLTNVATSVNSAGFSALPTVANPDTCWLVLDPEGTAGTPEIVQVTVHTAAATVCTIVRGQQTAFGGSTARQHAVGTKWVLALTPSDLLFLLNQVLTTKGDIPAFSTTPTRLAVGSNGTVLTANSSQATGLEWTTPGTSVRHGVQAGSSVTTTATSGTTVGVAFNTEQFDTDGYHDNVTNNSRFTVPAGLGGLYVVSCQFNLGLSGGNGFAGLLLNGNFFFAGSGAIARFSVSQPVLLNAGDFVEAALRGISGDVTSSVLTGSASEVSSPRFVMALVSV